MNHITIKKSIKIIAITFCFVFVYYILHWDGKVLDFLNLITNLMKTNADSTYNLKNGENGKTKAIVLIELHMIFTTQLSYSTDRSFKFYWYLKGELPSKVQSLLRNSFSGSLAPIIQLVPESNLYHKLSQTERQKT